jgi:hypothetical protein
MSVIANSGLLKLPPLCAGFLFEALNRRRSETTGAGATAEPVQVHRRKALNGQAQTATTRARAPAVGF